MSRESERKRKRYVSLVSLVAAFAVLAIVWIAESGLYDDLVVQQWGRTGGMQTSNASLRAELGSIRRAQARDLSWSSHASGQASPGAEVPHRIRVVARSAHEAPLERIRFRVGIHQEFNPNVAEVELEGETDRHGELNLYANIPALSGSMVHVRCLDRNLATEGDGPRRKSTNYSTGKTEFLVVLREKDCVLQGRVSDQDGQPIRAATIRAMSEATSSEANGEWELRVLSGERPLQVTVNAEGYRRERIYLGSRGPNSAHCVDVVLTKDSSRIVHGTIRARDGLPLSDASVYLNSHPFRRWKTRDDGRYTVQSSVSMRRGTEFLVVEAKGHPIAYRVLDAEDEELDVLMQSGFSIAGNVVALDGSPLAGVQVTVGPAGLPPLSCRTASDGRFEALVERAGSYEISALDSQLCFEKQEVVVPISGALVLRELSSVRISGRVIDEHGRTVPNAIVWCAEPGRGWNAQVSTDNDGTFTIGGVPDVESLQVEAHARGYGKATERIDASCAREVLLRVPSSLQIAGTVIDAAAREPVTSFQLGVDSDDLNESLAPTDADGLTWIRVRSDDGRWVLSDVSCSTAPLRLRVSSPGYVEGAFDVAPVSDGGTGNQLELVKAGRVSGRVLDSATGAVLEGATVALASGRRGALRSGSPCRTDENGEFVVDGVPSGQWMLEIAKEGFEKVALDGMANIGITTRVADVHLVASPDVSVHVIGASAHDSSLKLRLRRIEGEGLIPFAERNLAGEVTIFERVASSEYLLELVEAEAGAEAVLTGTQIRVEPGVSANVHLAVSTAGASIEGAISCGSDLPEVVTVSAMLLSAEAGPGVRTMAQALARSGRFRIDGLAAGNYLLTATWAELGARRTCRARTAVTDTGTSRVSLVPDKK